MTDVAPRSRRPGSKQGGGRKTRTSDCQRCVILRSLQHASLPATTVDAICDRMWLNRVRRRQVLYTEGNQATHVYTLRSGMVKLTHTDSRGREFVSEVLHTGDLFGFEAVFGGAYETGAQAIVDSEVCLAAGAEIRALMERVPGVATELSRYLYSQIRLARERQQCLSVTGAPAKLASFLLHSLGPDQDVGGGNRVVAGDLTLKDLSGILGVAPETVCRARRDLDGQGIIETLPSGIRIRDLASLERVAAV